MVNNVAIITARGGSKRIPRKNIRDFLGFPIIKYSIEAAIKSGCFSEVMVSTDDAEIADVARQFGAKVPFLRSADTSNDFATTADVIAEVIAEYAKLEQTFDCFCCIYPTAPFVTPEKLIKSLEKLKESDADSLIPVVRFGYPIQRALKVEEGMLKMIWPENMTKRSQDLIPAFHDCGQFYWMKTSSFLEQRTLFATHTVPFEVPESEVQDIDNEEDWKISEIKYRVLVQGL